MLYFLLGVNVVGLICLIFLNSRGGYWDALLYPALYDFLDERFKCSATKKRIISTIFTIVFLPIIVVYFIFLFAFSFGAAAIFIITDNIQKS